MYIHSSYLRSANLKTCARPLSPQSKSCYIYWTSECVLLFNTYVAAACDVVTRVKIKINISIDAKRVKTNK